MIMIQFFRKKQHITHAPGTGLSINLWSSPIFLSRIVLVTLQGLDRNELIPVVHPTAYFLSIYQKIAWDPVSRVLSGIKIPQHSSILSLRHHKLPAINPVISGPPHLTCLILLRMGFTAFSSYLKNEWALTSLFHPYRWKPPAVSFLLHFPSDHSALALPGILPCGARTFLERNQVSPASARISSWYLSYHLEGFIQNEEKLEWFV